MNGQPSVECRKWVKKMFNQKYTSKSFAQMKAHHKYGQKMAWLETKLKTHKSSSITGSPRWIKTVWEPFLRATKCQHFRLFPHRVVPHLSNQNYFKCQTKKLNSKLMPLYDLQKQTRQSERSDSDFSGFNKL